jgi:DNA-binding beta-propeller fold protein YncE/mono/diheme cytochrome c family protein
MHEKQPARIWGVALALAVSVSWVAAADQGLPALRPEARKLRRPVAAALLTDDHTLGVANQRSGTLSLVDLRQGRLRAEFAVGAHLTGLAVLPDRKHVLVVDDRRHQLIALSCAGNRCTPRARLTVSPYPASVAVQPDGQRATIASLWSRRVEVVDLTALSAGTGPVTLRTLHVIRLPFAPRDQCVLPRRGQVVVADAFGGHLAVVDVAAGRLVAVQRLTGHNLRGLAISPDRRQLLVSHQILDQKAPTTLENVRHGLLMANVLRLLPLDRLTERADLDRLSRVIRLGGVGAGAGDPAGTAFVAGGQVVVALAGVNEAAVVSLDGRTVRRLAVGGRPTVVLVGAQGPAVVVNTLGDSLSVLDPRRGRVTRTISLGAQPELGPQDRGELLFHDARLGRDGWLSCHSCHSDGHTNGLLADTLGDNTYGTPKRTLTLRNTALTDPWAWNGGVKYLHDQVRKSLVETMHAPSVSQGQVDDLTSFLHTLPPPPPLEPVTDRAADRAGVERGRRIFQERGCVRCHIPPLTYSSGGTYDVGFADEKGLRKFNPPSLRGVSQGYRFLHDNRAATLEEVFTRFRHKVGADMPPSRLADLLRFLRSL